MRMVVGDRSLPTGCAISVYAAPRFRWAEPSDNIPPLPSLPGAKYVCITSFARAPPGLRAYAAKHLISVRGSSTLPLRNPRSFIDFNKPYHTSLTG